MERKEHAEGPSVNGKNVENVMSSGRAILNMLAMLDADGIVPNIPLRVIGRERGG